MKKYKCYGSLRWLYGRVKGTAIHFMHHLLHIFSKNSSVGIPFRTHYMFNENLIKSNSNYTCNEGGAQV